MTFHLTSRQSKFLDLAGSDASHVMAYGGSRSGKTFITVRTICIRALAHRSRHAMLRFRFNHIKSSIIYDTFPKVMELCWPELNGRWKVDKSDWFVGLPNGSEIWFGGLDDKERTEKILGQEYASIFLNECSQISWAARNTALTRLAQKTPLRNKMYYDCNPPGKAHWTYQVFVDKKSPDTKKPLADPHRYGAIMMNPVDNAVNIDGNYLNELRNLPEKQRRRFFDGQFASADETALWTVEILEQCRADEALPTMRRIIIAVDPSGCSGDEDKRSDEVGIIVAGIGDDGRAYVLEDLSGRMAPGQWGQKIAQAYDRHQADCVIAETNFGGAMVGAIVKAARPGTPFREVHASRGKHVRAEPVAELYQLDKIRHAGEFMDLEDQMCAMTTAGYIGSKSPDRADALVWALTELFPGVIRQPVNMNLQSSASKGGMTKKKGRR